MKKGDLYGVKPSTYTGWSGFLIERSRCISRCTRDM